MREEGRQQGRIRVALVQSQIKEESDSSCLAQVASLLEDARGADLVLLPELWRGGCFDSDSYARRAEAIGGETASLLRRQARDLGAFVLGGSLVERDDGRLYNTAVLLDREGTLVSVYRKIHLLDYQSQERRVLSAGEAVVVVPTEMGVFGLATCYDLRFPELFRTMAERGAEVFLVPAAWPSSRVEAWDALTRARAVENQAYVVACDGTGRGLLGRSRVVDPWGVIAASLGEGPGVLSAEIDLARLREYREEFPAWRER